MTKKVWLSVLIGVLVAVSLVDVGLRFMGPRVGGERQDIIRAFHRGDPPCLRYGWAEAFEAEVEAVAQALFAAGIGPELFADLLGLILRWGDERELQIHGATSVEEIEKSSGGGGIVQRLQAKRVARKISQVIEHTPGPPPQLAEGAWARLSPEQQRTLRTQWEQHPVAFHRSFVGVLRWLRVRETRQRVERIAEEIRAMGEAPERLDQLKGLAPELLEDAWGAPLKYASAPGGVRVASWGQDASEGGEGYDADIVADVPLDAAAAMKAPAPPSEPAKAECRPLKQRVTIKRADRDAALGDVNELGMQARIVPAFQGGKAVGFKIFGIHAGSPCEHVGLCDGDIVTEIAGYKMDSPEKALNVYTALKERDRVMVRVRRGGSEQSFTIEVK